MRIRRVDAAGGELMNNKIRCRPIHVTFSGGEYKGSMLDNVNVIQTSNTPELGPVMRLAGGLDARTPFGRGSVGAATVILKIL